LDVMQGPLKGRADVMSVALRFLAHMAIHKGDGVRGIFNHASVALSLPMQAVLCTTPSSHQHVFVFSTIHRPHPLPASPTAQAHVYCGTAQLPHLHIGYSFNCCRPQCMRVLTCVTLSPFVSLQPDPACGHDARCPACDRNPHRQPGCACPLPIPCCGLPHLPTFPMSSSRRLPLRFHRVDTPTRTHTHAFTHTHIHTYTHYPPLLLASTHSPIPPLQLTPLSWP
jgi:hypothetical protein